MLISGFVTSTTGQGSNSLASAGGLQKLSSRFAETGVFNSSLPLPHHMEGAQLLLSQSKGMALGCRADIRAPQEGEASCPS